MNAGDEAARAARAMRLHEQIEKLKSPPPEPAGAPAAVPDPEGKPPSIREQIERKMREIDKNDKQ
jgi:hypothetical protein